MGSKIIKTLIVNYPSFLPDKIKKGIKDIIKNLNDHYDLSILKYQESDMDILITIRDASQNCFIDAEEIDDFLVEYINKEVNELFCQYFYQNQGFKNTGI